jgi:hypothetical protein
MNCRILHIGATPNSQRCSLMKAVTCETGGRAATGGAEAVPVCLSHKGKIRRCFLQDLIGLTDPNARTVSRTSDEYGFEAFLLDGCSIMSKFPTVLPFGKLGAVHTGIHLI